jgi:saccharopine dehydrogenase-like NADP-dependent oxidoreductase
MKIVVVGTGMVGEVMPALAERNSSDCSILVAQRNQLKRKSFSSIIQLWDFKLVS